MPLVVALVASTALGVAGLGAKSCEGDYCRDTAWCNGERCGAYNLHVSSADHDSKEVAACKSFKNAALKKVDKGSDDEYCISHDTSKRGFKCFDDHRGGWVGAIYDFLGGNRENMGDDSLSLNSTNCEELDVGEVPGGLKYLAGRCCAGEAVPCNSESCMKAFEPKGWSFTSSPVSIMLVICAIVHLLSAGNCLIFADRVIANVPSAEDLASHDKKAFKNIVAMLGAAHGGFAAVLIFGALQDWYYGKCQISLAALGWYGILGPIAEAMQHGSKPYTLTHYLNVCISVSKGQCGGNPPKINYMMLCIGMLVAVGVEVMKSQPLIFIVAASMITLGFVTSVVVSQFVPTEKLPDTMSEMR